MLVAVGLAACGGSDGTPTPSATAIATALPYTIDPSRAAVPRTTPPAEPLDLPADDRPHQFFTEWWYYTGHLDIGQGKTLGFELVVFQVRPQAERPVYISHFAITDPDRGYLFDQRISLSPQAIPPQGLDFNLDGWRMTGYDGHDQLVASMPSAAIDLRLAAEKPPVPHGGAGLMELPPSGWTFYYTRSRIAVEGTVTLDGAATPATGMAWFDHQWGDFNPAFGGGGWDWFSTQLDDGSELMTVVLKDSAGTPVGGFGTFVAADETVTALQQPDVTADATGSWTSPATGITYPSGWRIAIPRFDLELTYLPIRPDQEFDARTSTGNVYWEGAVTVTGTRDGRPVHGRGYVELTGYAERRSP